MLRSHQHDVDHIDYPQMMMVTIQLRSDDIITLRRTITTLSFSRHTSMSLVTLHHSALTLVTLHHTTMTLVTLLSHYNDIDDSPFTPQ
jgi:hypothetical protein